MDGEATVGDKDVPGHKGSLVGGKKERCVGDIPRRGDPSQRMDPFKRRAGFLRVLGLRQKPGRMGVSTVPGATALTRMPKGAYSMAIARVSAWSPPLEAQ